MKFIQWKILDPIIIEYQMLSQQDLADKLGLKKRTLKARLKRLGIKKNIGKTKKQYYVKKLKPIIVKRAVGRPFKVREQKQDKPKKIKLAVLKPASKLKKPPTVKTKKIKTIKHPVPIKKPDKVLENRNIDLSKLEKLWLDSKTVIYVKPNSDHGAIINKFLNRKI